MITAIVDLQFGSTGKGLLAGFLSKENEYDVVVSANMPNAGHTFVHDDGYKVINKVLPSGVYSKNLGYICIGPGAVFDPLRLQTEINELRGVRGIEAVIAVHPDAALLMPGHKDAEKALNHIASTMQGSMEAMFHKMRRHDIGANTVWTNHGILSQIDVIPGGTDQKTLWDCVVDRDTWHAIMMGAKEILMEGSQGYSLGINAGFYPYCTSRDCTVWRLLSDCCVPMREGKLKVIGSARVHPIRVGNTEGGNSGPHYRDQQELRWKDIGVEPEHTTVTGRERRVFSFSDLQITEAMIMNRVDQVFLNFCNYDEKEAIAVRKRIDRIAMRMMKQRMSSPVWLEEGEYYPMVRYMGFGPSAADVMRIPGYD